jgi:hypothetical protein
MAFTLIFTAALFLILRAGISRSLWVIPISSAMAYIAAILAYVAYFALFEPQRLLNSFLHSTVLDLGLLLLIGPTVTLTWLFGAISGTASLIWERWRDKSTR